MADHMRVPHMRVPNSVGLSPAESTFQLHVARVESNYERIWKPAFDRCVALALLIVASPVIALTAVAVRLNLGRPVLFRQTRIGRDGVEFTVYKFRTMLPDRRSHHVGSYVSIERRRTHKTPDDPRHTPLGRFLRKTGIDELPQLINVIRGEMSLVGPRPELPEIVARYQPWQHHRHVVRPGITGIWQVSARSDWKLMHEATEYDIDYVSRVSFKTDLGIILRTVPSMIRNGGGH